MTPIAPRFVRNQSDSAARGISNKNPAPVDEATKPAITKYNGQ